ncbi:hypothetical protein [Burkholderia ambifaria]|uniref:hypothetical protein n=1 Tax=Burkholderia ambifaria TaxID=152480 RepID=UPI0015887AE6|nr:hypothetical protein [Burkholderia ambifaria]
MPTPLRSMTPRRRERTAIARRTVGRGVAIPAHATAANINRVVSGITETPDRSGALDYPARGPAPHSDVARATNYLDLGKKLFSLLRYREKPVPTTMAATAGMLAATCRARIARARSRVRTPSASHAGVSRRPHALLA